MGIRGRIKDFWIEQRLFEQRALATVFIVAALTLVLLSRLIWLQVLRHDEYTDLAQGNRVRIEAQPHFWCSNIGFSPPFLVE